MATNPYFTQYHTQRFSFIGSPQQRDGTYSKDQRFVNMYPELIKSPISDGKKYYLKKRPGLANYTTLGSGPCRGAFFWGGYYYIAVGNTLYRGEFPGSFGAIITMSTSSGPVGFAEYRGTSNDNWLFFCDGVGGWTVAAGATGGVIQITDANFPNPHIPTPIFLDGYIFLPGANSQRIYNSDLENMYTWPTDGFIDAEMFPDVLVGLAKSQNYLACIGTESIEWLYDNGNATGSPLQRNAPAVSQFGCPAPQTVSQTEKELILVGQTGNGGRTVWVINGFQPTEIASEPVREALDHEAGYINQATAYTIQCAGHKWYVLNLNLAQRTFVYDFDEQMWHEWTSGVNGFAQARWQYDFGADSANGYPVLCGTSNSNTCMIANLDPNTYTDQGMYQIFCQVITVKIDFDTIQRKRFYRLSLITDAPNGNTNVPMTVNWSDDDYNTWVGNKTLNINATFPTIMQLGYSRRRAFQFLYDQPYALRMEAFELDIIQEVRR